MAHHLLSLCLLFISVRFITLWRQFCFPLIVDHMKMAIVCCNNGTIIPKNMTIPIYHTLPTNARSEHVTSQFSPFHLLSLLLCRIAPHILTIYTFFLPRPAHRTPHSGQLCQLCLPFLLTVHLSCLLAIVFIYPFFRWIFICALCVACVFCHNSHKFHNKLLPPTRTHTRARSFWLHIHYALCFSISI